MRSITITLLFFILCHFTVSAQVADGINYQAIALDDTGNPIVGTDAAWNIIDNRQFNVRFSIHEGSPGGQLLYQEVHLAHTDPFGLFSLVIGHGEPAVSGLYDKLTDIMWGVEKLYLKVEIDILRNGSYRLMDNQQMMAVPFAFHALSAGALSTIRASEDHDPARPIFSVLNSKGDTVFAVYESGVVINIEDDSGKGSRSGFAVGGFSSTKGGDYIEYLRVDPGYVRISIDDDSDLKGSRGGFAVGGFSSGKITEGIPDYFHLTPGSALFQLDIDDSDKGSRGGFAVGGFSSSKGDALARYLTVRHDSIRIYIDDLGDKGSRGGFAVGGFSSNKQGDGFEFLRIDPGYVRISIDDYSDLKGSRGGFAVGGFSSQKQSDPLDYLLITPGSAEFLLDEDSGKGSRSGFAVGGFSSLKGGLVTEFMNLSADSARVYIDESEGRGGFAVVERGSGKSADYDVLYVAPERTSVYLKENSKNGSQGFSVFNREADYVDRLFTVSEEGTFVATLFEATPVLYTSLGVVGSSTATAGGVILSTGGADITEYGIVYSTMPNPTTASPGREFASDLAEPVTGGFEFSFDLTGLQPGTTYYIRSYARNRTGVGYGQIVQFTTAPGI